MAHWHPWWSTAYALAIGLLGTLAGCSQVNQAELKALETREIDLPYDETYKAAMNGVFALGFTIDHSDKESGVLTGKRHDPNTGAKVGAAIAFGIIGLLATGDRSEAVSFMISPLEPKLTQIRMKVIINGKPVLDRTVFTKIWQQIEREAMMDSRPSTRVPAVRPSSPQRSG